MATIRKATVEDAGGILRLTKCLFSELGHQRPMNDQQSVLFCRDILTSGEYRVFLSNGAQGHANGVITLSEGLSIYAAGRFGVIREFYVVPDMRSRGIGKAFYAFYLREGFGEIGPRLKLENLNEL